MPTRVCVKVKVFEGIFPLKINPEKHQAYLLPDEQLELEDSSKFEEATQPSDEQEDGEYEIEKVVDHSHDEQGTEFRIRFLNYPPSEDRWYDKTSWIDISKKMNLTSQMGSSMQLLLQSSNQAEK